ncbi:uncharacterized protein LOC119659731 isoform X2 [Hermetia illucens]|uniref:uncharacterized protein LOC119659731 isoform X2 n=1 Tax=Hermetia illucens TaxID=343691 RepID=UPI0018CC3B11|nr:uncharacterized protein LOC119659731 isoform X2 [Hermetia illucens]
MGSSTDANLPVLFDLKFIRNQTDLYKTVVDRIRLLYPDLEDDSVSAVAKEYFREKLSSDPMEMARSINGFTRDKSKTKNSVSQNRTSISKKDTNIAENASKLITHGNKETTAKPLQPKIKSPKLRNHTENSTSSSHKSKLQRKTKESAKRTQTSRDEECVGNEHKSQNHNRNNISCNAKEAEVKILPKHIKFEDFRKFTNIESIVKEDIIKKFPTNHNKYLAQIDKYIKRHYDTIFIKLDKWPVLIKFHDSSIKTLEDLICVKNQSSMENQNKQEKPINPSPDMFPSSGETNKDTVIGEESNPVDPKLINYTTTDAGVALTKPADIGRTALNINPGYCLEPNLTSTTKLPSPIEKPNSTSKQKVSSKRTNPSIGKSSTSSHPVRGRNRSNQARWASNAADHDVCNSSASEDQLLPSKIVTIESFVENCVPHYDKEKNATAENERLEGTVGKEKPSNQSQDMFPSSGENPNNDNSQPKTEIFGSQESYKDIDFYDMNNIPSSLTSANLLSEINDPLALNSQDPSANGKNLATMNISSNSSSNSSSTETLIFNPDESESPEEKEPLVYEYEEKPNITISPQRFPRTETNFENKPSTRESLAVCSTENNICPNNDTQEPQETIVPDILTRSYPNETPAIKVEPTDNEQTSPPTVTNDMLNVLHQLCSKLKDIESKIKESQHSNKNLLNLPSEIGVFSIGTTNNEIVKNTENLTRNLEKLVQLNTNANIKTEKVDEVHESVTCKNEPTEPSDSDVQFIPNKLVQPIEIHDSEYTASALLAEMFHCAETPSTTQESIYRNHIPTNEALEISPSNLTSCRLSQSLNQEDIFLNRMSEGNAIELSDPNESNWHSAPEDNIRQPDLPAPIADQIVENHSDRFTPGDEKEKVNTGTDEVPVKPTMLEKVQKRNIEPSCEVIPKEKKLCKEKPFETSIQKPKTPLISVENNITKSDPTTAQTRNIFKRKKNSQPKSTNKVSCKKPRHTEKLDVPPDTIVPQVKHNFQPLALVSTSKNGNSTALKLAEKKIRGVISKLQQKKVETSIDPDYFIEDVTECFDSDTASQEERLNTLQRILSEDETFLNNFNTEIFRKDDPLMKSVNDETDLDLHEKSVSGTHITMFQIPTNLNFCWITFLNMQTIPRSIVTHLYYNSNFPLPSFPKASMLQSKCKIVRDECLRFRISSFNLEFHFELDATNEENMISLLRILEIVVPENHSCSADDLVIARGLQHILDQFRRFSTVNIREEFFIFIGGATTERSSEPISPRSIKYDVFRDLSNIKSLVRKVFIGTSRKGHNDCMDCVEPFIKYYYEDHFKNLKSWPEKVKLQNSEVHIPKLNMSSVEARSRRMHDPINLKQSEQDILKEALRKKTLQIRTPKAISLEQFRKHTNIKRLIRSDIKRKYPLNPNKYLKNIEKYIDEFYENKFKKLPVWPKQIKYNENQV